MILSAPAKGTEPVDANVVLGVNFETVYDPERRLVELAERVMAPVGAETALARS